MAMYFDSQGRVGSDRHLDPPEYPYETEIENAQRTFDMQSDLDKLYDYLDEFTDDLYQSLTSTAVTAILEQIENEFHGQMMDKIAERTVEDCGTPRILDPEDFPGAER
jgi:3-methyladenine DNA glycosylase/8-oxoguanine DNA glycosylase